MRPTRRVLSWAALLIIMTFPTMVACGRGATPGGSPSASPSATATASPTTSASASPIASPSATVPSTPGPGWTVEVARVAYPWRWPTGSVEAAVGHTTSVPPVPELVMIGAANHPSDPNDRPYNRISFSFSNGYPSYRFMYVDHLVADPSGRVVALDGYGALRIVFNPAQAHTTDGTASSIVSQPPAHLAMNRILSYAQAGDFEGYLTYGLGITYPIRESNPQIQVRVYEVTYVSARGDHRYVVAFDLDAR